MQKPQTTSADRNDYAFVDYKDVETLKKFINPHARMLSKKKTGMSAKTQRLIAMAVKRARFMALLPYVAQ